MEKCPQCTQERVLGENFCDNCGYKYADQPEPPNVQESSETSEQNLENQQNDTLESPLDQQPAIWLQNNGINELAIYFDENPKIIGRGDVSEFLKALNKDPLQFSRKQCTISKEGNDYFIEDGMTSVQDKPSGNHTTVNGKDITEQGKIKLQDNDKIVLATMIEAVFCMR